MAKIDVESYPGHHGNLPFYLPIKKKGSGE